MFRVSSDVGGTFTDVAVCDIHGRTVIGKGLTDRKQFFSGMEVGLQICANELGLPDVRALLAATSEFVVSTTQATNAVLEGRTARTGFITTAGFESTLLLREGGKSSPYQHSIAFPEPYIPRWLTLGVRERIDSRGNVGLGLTELEIQRVLEWVDSRHLEALGISLLWSIANATHEESLARAVAGEFPELPVTVGSRLNPTIREYRRASSVVIDASLKPIIQENMIRLASCIQRAGFDGRILVGTSEGGVLPLENVLERPILLLRSGPSLAPVAAHRYASDVLTSESFLTCDTGGTSFDVSLTLDGAVARTRETWLGEKWMGHISGFPSVDVRSIGAGGGSIAWIDSGGLLRVGPESASSDPGPACYGRGGSRPTVTDAAVVLGLLGPDNFSGGRMVLNEASASEVFEPLAAELGLSTPAAAARAVLRVATEQMVQAIYEMTVSEGLDPRELALIAGGGAAGLNMLDIAQELKITKVVFPGTASALSACGGLYADVVTEFSGSLLSNSSSFDEEAVAKFVSRLEVRARSFLAELSEGIISQSRLKYQVEARYPGQAWEIPIPFDGPSQVHRLDTLIQEFHDAHRRIFEVSEPGSAIEFVNWTVSVCGERNRPNLSADGGAVGRVPASGASREVYMSNGDKWGFELVPRVWMPDALGVQVDGPALLESNTTTIFVPRGWHGSVDSMGHFYATSDGAGLSNVVSELETTSRKG